MIHLVVLRNHYLVVLILRGGAYRGQIESLRTIDHMPVTYQVRVVCYYT